MTWDDYFLRLARAVAAKSKDASTQVGCVIVGPDREVRSTGYNGFPRGADDDRADWHVRPLKYKVTEHAERNAIYNAARHGAGLKGCTIYVPWHPCSDCARGVIQSGIAAVVLDPGYDMDPALRERWADDLAVAADLFETCGVAVRWGLIGGDQ